MRKIISVMLLLSLVCVCFTGCISWETPVKYELMHDVSEILSIRIYCTDDGSDVVYNYSDPDDPCRILIGEIPSEHYSNFVEELVGLSFSESHMILMVPLPIDPNFYYGKYLVKVEYIDGRCELISNPLSYQFEANGDISKLIRYSIDRELWLSFLQNWVDIEEK